MNKGRGGSWYREHVLENVFSIPLFKNKARIRDGVEADREGVCVWIDTKRGIMCVCVCVCVYVCVCVCMCVCVCVCVVFTPTLLLGDLVRSRVRDI